MRGFNRAIIAGNLTRDPEVRYTVNKKAYARFTLAVNNRYKDANGEYQETADYINIVAWGNFAEICGKYLKKGSPVLVEGRIRTGSYEAKDGSGKRYTTEVFMDNMVMLGSREQSGSGGGYSGGYSQAQDFGPSEGYVPSSSDFGNSIGESGFGGGNFTQDFANSNNSIPNNIDETSIPF